MFFVKKNIKPKSLLPILQPECEFNSKAMAEGFFLIDSSYSRQIVPIKLNNEFNCGIHLSGLK